MKLSSILILLTFMSVRHCAYSCTCPIGYGSMEEDGKPICGLVVCDVPQSDICAFATILARYLLATVHLSCDGGHTVEEEVYECTHAVDQFFCEVESLATWLHPSASFSLKLSPVQ